MLVFLFSSLLPLSLGTASPSEFIVGPGGSYGDSFVGQELTWEDAKAFCASKGGKLPDWTNYSVAGGFPEGAYWTRDENGANVAFVLVGTQEGLFSGINSPDKKFRFKVVCVK